MKNNKAPVFSLRKRTKIHDLTQTINAQNSNPSPADYENNPENYGSSSYGSRYKRLSYSGSRSKRFLNSGNFEMMKITEYLVLETMRIQQTCRVKGSI